MDYSIHTLKIHKMVIQFWDAIEYNRHEEALLLSQKIKIESVLLLEATELAVKEYNALCEAQKNKEVRYD